jgi:hypothetical protein
MAGAVKQTGAAQHAKTHAVQTAQDMIAPAGDIADT